MIFLNGNENRLLRYLMLEREIIYTDSLIL